MRVGSCMFHYLFFSGAKGVRLYWLVLLLCDHLTSPSAVSGLYFFCITLKAKYLISDLLLLKGKELANTRGFAINKNINTRILIYLYFSEIALLQKIKHDG